MLHLDLLQSQACNKLLDKPLGVTTTIGTAADHGSALGLVQGAGSELGGDFHLCRQGTELASDVELSASAHQSRSCWRRESTAGNQCGKISPREVAETQNIASLYSRLSMRQVSNYTAF